MRVRTHALMHSRSRTGIQEKITPVHLVRSLVDIVGAYYDTTDPQITHQSIYGRSLAFLEITQACRRHARPADSIVHLPVNISILLRL